jgi:WD domain, G-beta repeat
VDGKKWPDTGLAKRMVGVLQLAFTPDGRYALAQLDQELLQVWDLTADAGVGHAFNFATPGPSGFRQVPLMHPAPDSRRVALVEADPKVPSLQRGQLSIYRWRLGVYELDTRRRVSGVAGVGVLTAVDWSPDSALIAGAGRRTDPEHGADAGFAFVATAGGQFLLHPTDLPKPATAAALSPDGRTLAVGTGGEVHLYEVRTGRLRHAFQPNAGDVSGLRFHPTGRSLLSESSDGAVFLWDVRGELAKPAEPDAAALDRLWTDLGAENAAPAFRAIRSITAHPAKTLPDLKQRVTLQKRPTAAEIAERVANLSSRLYAERVAAEKELKAMGRIAHPALKAALAADSSAELHARAGRLLATTITPAAVRTTRLVEAVELAGTAEAKALLAAWAAEAGPELAAEAEAALARWPK